EPVPVTGYHVENRIETGHVGDVAMAGNMCAQFGGEWLDALAEGIALIGQRELGALIRASLGDAPCDRSVVGHAEDQTALAGHKALTCRHEFSPLTGVARCLSHRRFPPSSIHPEREASP